MQEHVEIFKNRLQQNHAVVSERYIAEIIEGGVFGLIVTNRCGRQRTLQLRKGGDVTN